MLGLVFHLILAGVQHLVAAVRVDGGQHVARPGCALPFAVLLRLLEEERASGRHRRIAVPIATAKDDGPLRTHYPLLTHAAAA